MSGGSYEYLTLVRCIRCRHYTPAADVPGWGSCSLRALPSMAAFGLRDPVWSGQFERECQGFEEAEP